MPTPLKNEIGNRYGLLTVISRADNVKGKSCWNCQCDCGNNKDAVLARSLRSGGTISCGCQRRGRKSSEFTSEVLKVKRQKYYNELKKLIELNALKELKKRKKNKMRLVILESPYAGDILKNIQYARRCVRDSLLRGESPIASHLLYTQDSILNDTIPAERQLGIDAGLAWKVVAEATVVYADLGITDGMKYGIAQAKKLGLKIEIRYLFKKGE